MLTPSDNHNIANFEKLNKNHQRVFRHRLIRKCNSAIVGLQKVLLLHDRLEIKAKRISGESLWDLLDTYEMVYELQNT